MPLFQPEIEPEMPDASLPRLDKKMLIGVGYAKCGTTTAHDILSTSALISAPSIKETGFFSKDFDRGLDYYKSLYPAHDPAPIMLDITPSYHMHKEAYPRIKATAPDHLILVFLRDPIRRAFSLYRHQIANHYAGGDRGSTDAAEVFAAPFRKSFGETATSRGGYCLDLVTSVQRMRNHFHQDDIMLIYFDEVSDGSFVDRIEARLGYPLDITRRTGWSNKRFNVRYELAEENGAPALVLKRGGKVAKRWPIEQIGWPAACNAVAATQYWSRYVPRSEYDRIYEKLYEKMDLEGVGIDRARLFQPGDIFHAP